MKSYLMTANYMEGSVHWLFTAYDYKRANDKVNREYPSNKFTNIKIREVQNGNHV